MHGCPSAHYSVLLHLGVEGHDCLGRLADVPRAFVGRLQALEDLGGLKGLGRAPAAGLTYPVQQLLGKFQVIEGLAHSFLQCSKASSSSGGASRKASGWHTSPLGSTPARSMRASACRSSSVFSNLRTLIGSGG